MFCEHHLQELLRIEDNVNYCFSPPKGCMPFVIIERKSPILLSAPHGAITFRDNGKEIWHEEDEYTAGIALVLAELFQTSVIATTWKTEDSDPNFHHEQRSPYKQNIRQLVEKLKIKYVIDLHGAKAETDKIPYDKLVDLGTMNELNSIDTKLADILEKRINDNLYGDFVNRNGFPASALKSQMSITAFCRHELKIESVQIEMKPLVRIPMRRIDSSAYARGETLKTEPALVMSMLHGIGEFLIYLTKIVQTT